MVKLPKWFQRIQQYISFNEQGDAFKPLNYAILERTDGGYWILHSKSTDNYLCTLAEMFTDGNYFCEWALREIHYKPNTSFAGNVTSVVKKHYKVFIHYLYWVDDEHKIEIDSNQLNTLLREGIMLMRREVDNLVIYRQDNIIKITDTLPY